MPLNFRMAWWLMIAMAGTVSGGALVPRLARADASPPGGAELAPENVWTFKLTPSYYATQREPDASDVNLRAHYGAHALWLGYYRRGGEFEQTRSGYEYTAQLGNVQLVPSLQLATHGFLGGALNAQIGGAVYGLLGYGRTNAKDYYNLNFDPNDAVTYGLGTTLLPRSNLAVFTVRDNRLHTEQAVTHLVWRFTPGDRQRWTFDYASKHGRATADDETVRGSALSLTYDWHDVFVRFARDSKVNFSTNDQTRVSIGFRF